MLKPISWSQNNTFSICQRMWYYKYIRKIPTVQDMCYAEAGSILHKILELYYNGDIIEQIDLKKHFNVLWNKYKLDNTKLRLKKDAYWLMVLNGIALKKEITSTELKIFFPDVVGYIDGVDSKNDEILDWKSSTRSIINEEEYTKQLKFYSYLYYRKFNRLPNKATVYYLKYTGTKGELCIIPTYADIINMGKWHSKTRKSMDVIRNNSKITPPRCERCAMFCPYTNLCMESTDNVIKFNLRVLGHYIYIDGPINDLLNKGLTKKFSYELKNAYFIKKARPNANTTVCFWNYNKRLLPIGFMNGLLKTLGDYAKYKKLELVIDIDDKRIFDNTEIKMPNKFVNDRKLRDYQNEAVNIFLRNKIGILELGTGAGKTEISIECIRQLGMKTLFVTDKIELLRQTKKRIEDSLGIKVGQIGGNVCDIKDINVATIQTLSKLWQQNIEVKNKLKILKMLAEVRFVTFDETHKAAARSYQRLGTYLINTEYRLGISGTAYRDDGNDMMINAVTGYKIFELNSKTLIKNGWLIKPRIIFIKDYIDTSEINILVNNIKKGLINETPNYQNYYKGIIQDNFYRNLVVTELVRISKGKKILILTKLIDHGKLLKSKIKNSEHLYGATSKKEREEMFKRFESGDLDVLISTISIFAEGIDIPKLGVVINASANRGDVKTIQLLGRVLRKLDGKKEAFYYDFCDETIFFRNAFLARKRALIKQGHDIEIIKSTSLYTI